MFCVVYEFKVKPGANAEFEIAWAAFTEAIHRVCGSLGSRLHTTGDSQTYVAYAQWPLREIFSRQVSEDAYRQDELNHRVAMSDSLWSSKKIYELEVLDDHLR